ncbi:hypothetical protein JIP62_12965 [Brevundimonas vitis]|uniref:Uncharacterized protein n=1 Tax=Brevundimonas vitisensis TaxID=2800818 RepID=A0ABX7BLT1_9CAUL|nr:hypothetical protein [Brevundimonas vitisensis]QQQ18201.1 hypothetical protein JIP62_12965 [Brevundimonas vitisensis]
MSRLPCLVILTEGDAARGLGHVVRCSAYGQGWRARGGEVRWILDGDDRAAGVAAETGPVRRQPWQSGPLPDIAPDEVALVDSYALSQDLAEGVLGRAQQTVFIDDLGSLAYPGGLVVSPAVQRADRAGAAEWLMGPRWQPLRPAFRIVPKRTAVSDQVRRVLVSLGGTDVRSLSARVVSVVRRLLPEAAIDVLGPAPAEPGVIAYLDRDAAAVARLMAQADLAISAGGQTIFELAACGTPTVMIAVAANQAANLALWPSLAGFEAAGAWDDPDLDQQVARAVVALAPSARRAGITARAQQAVDGGGVDRLLDRLTEAVPTLR